MMKGKKFLAIIVSGFALLFLPGCQNADTQTELSESCMVLSDSTKTLSSDPANFVSSKEPISNDSMENTEDDSDSSLFKSSLDSSSVRAKTSFPARDESPISKTNSSRIQKSASSSYTEDTQGMRVYVTPTGKRYHFIKSCGGKNSQETTLEQAENTGKTPCQKCAQ